MERSCTYGHIWVWNEKKRRYECDHWGCGAVKRGEPPAPACGACQDGMIRAAHHTCGIEADGPTPPAPAGEGSRGMKRDEEMCAVYGHKWEQTDWCVVRGAFWNSGLNVRACTRCGVLGLPPKPTT